VISGEGDPTSALSRFFDLAVSPAQRALLDRFFTLLLTWNARINLTGARTRADLDDEHLPDSFALARLIPPAAVTGDVGSGGGLPALPFAILRPDVPLTLFESRAKRAAFLRTAVRELPLPSVTVAARFPPPGEQRFDALVSRATLPPPDWLALARPALKDGGIAVVLSPTAVSAPPPARLVTSLSYQTANRHPRFAASYCFT
jgi:16S rRNA (guanine527-N7)-methyltransferase